MDLRCRPWSIRSDIQVALALVMWWMAVRFAWPDQIIRPDGPMAWQGEAAWAVECGWGGLVGLAAAWVRDELAEFLFSAMTLSAHLAMMGFLAVAGAPLLPGVLAVVVLLAGRVLWVNWRAVRGGWGNGRA